MNLFKLFASHGEQIFLVGGAVRDSILGKPIKDFDYATSALPDKTIAILKGAGLILIPIGIEFGTIQTIIDGEKVEITTFRCAESYKKGDRKPSVVFGKTIEEDLIRRDFTFNAMAMDGDGHILDPFGGIEDLKKRIIRTPGDSLKAFTDDPLRMLRAARFAARGFGTFSDPCSLAILKCSHLVKSLSGERIFEEMTKILLSNSPRTALRQLLSHGIVGYLFPHLEDLALDCGPVGDYHSMSIWDHTLAVVQNSPKIAEVGWAALFHDIGKIACRTVDERVHFIGHERTSGLIWRNLVGGKTIVVPNEFRNNVAQLIEEHMSVWTTGMKIKGARRLVYRLGNNLDNLIELAKADAKAHHPSHVQKSLDRLSEVEQLLKQAQSDPVRPVKAKLPKGTGEVVSKAFGVKGSELGILMKKLAQAVVDGDFSVENDPIEFLKVN